MKKILSLCSVLMLSFTVFSGLYFSGEESKMGLNSFVPQGYAAYRTLDPEDGDFCDENPFEDGCEPFEPPLPSINGSCESYTSNYIIQPAQNTSNGCAPGVYQDASDTSTEWRWTCNGMNGGTSASCSAAKNNTCTTGTESLHATHSTACSSVSHSLPYCFDVAGTEGTSGSCITRAEQSTVNIPVSPARTEYTWGKGRLKEQTHSQLCTKIGDAYNGSQTRTTYRPVTSHAGGICGSEENRPGTFNYTVLGISGSINGGGDLLRNHGGTSRCYKTGQRQDGDRSDKDVGWLCTYNVTAEQGTQCESYKVDYTCGDPVICTANEVDNETIACGSGFIGDQTRTNTCNSDGSAWLGWTSPYDRSACVPVVCTPNEENTETNICGAGFTGNQTRTNTCNSDGTAWLGWTPYDRSSCIADTSGSGCQMRYRIKDAGYTSPWRETPITNNTTTYRYGSWSDIRHNGDKQACRGSANCGIQMGIKCTGSIGVRVGYQRQDFGTSSPLQYTPWSDPSNTWQDGPWSYGPYNGGDEECAASRGGCGIRMLIESENPSILSCGISYQYQIEDRVTPLGSNGNWTKMYEDKDDRDCDESTGCGARAGLYCEQTNACTPNEVDTETIACGTGYTGDQTRTNTCNAAGTAWLGWTGWDNSECIELICTADEVDTETIACGIGYSGDQTRTNTCNSDGTAWLGWTPYDRSACVETTSPVGTVMYAPAGPAWTTSDVVVRITCSDVESGCDMVSSFPASWLAVFGVPNARERIYSSNVPADSVILVDNAGNSTFVPYSITYIDKSTPGAPTITADDRGNDIWSNDATTVLTTTANSTGEVSPRSNRYCMDGSNSCTPSSTATPNTSGLSDGTYYYRARTCTSAGRCGPVATFIIKIDATAPTSSDISVVPGTSGPLLANNNQNFQVTASENGGSPILTISSHFEDYATVDDYERDGSSNLSPRISTLDLDPSDADRLNFNASVEDVDANRESGGSREYSLRVYNVCDTAGNCTEELDDDGITTFDYEVYPNTNSFSVVGVTGNDLDDSSNIADGSDKGITITLRDIYGNDIIPASGISRTVSFDINTNNNLYLNQYDRSAGSSIFHAGSVWSIGDNIDTTFANQASTDGTYGFAFQAYTPTYQYSYSDPSGNFEINNISADIAGTLGAVSDIVINNSSIDSNFAPLYTTAFSGELRNNGFIEGAQQTSNLDVSKSASSASPSSRNIYLRYGGETSRLQLDVSLSGDPITPVSETDLSTILISNFGDDDDDFNTLLTQQGGTIEDIQETFLSSHVSYTLGGNDVVYNGDVIGKTNYHDTDIDNNTSQSGIKIVGVSSSQNTNELTTGQFTDDVTILGKLTKATSRKDIQASVFSVTKNITAVNGSSRITRLDGATWTNNPDGTKLKDNSVLYFGGLAGGDVELGNGGDEVVEGKKTIVIEGGNLYIRSNMQYLNASNDILGIVVLKDENGNGGNLYIDPDVTDIHATIYVDKSVISYDGTDELDGNTPASGLANQLYIFGSLFSENTIGGSRSNPLECPYYVSVCNSTVEAQKYDLNYLRRYILVDHDGLPGTPDQPAYSGSPADGDGGSMFDIYPVVVKYNSKVQSTPPPLFE